PGATLVNCVAMTEASAFISLSELDEPLESRLETGGKPLPGVECRIIDPDTGKDLPPGEPGELLFRGPTSSAATSGTRKAPRRRSMRTAGSTPVTSAGWTLTVA